MKIKIRMACVYIKHKHIKQKGQTRCKILQEILQDFKSVSDSSVETRYYLVKTIDILLSKLRFFRKITVKRRLKTNSIQ